MAASDAGGPDPDAGAGLPTEPPPTPFERGLAGRAAAPAAGPDRPGRRRIRAVLVVLAAVAVLGGGTAVLLGRSDGAAPAPATDAAAGPAAPDPVVDAALLALLEDVDAAERAMLAFHDAATAALGGAPSDEEALAGVAAAAATGAADLTALRPPLAGTLASAPADAVRVAYLPHLDAWIAYLEAVAAAPTTLFDASGDPFSLRIDATAGVFVAALEDAVAAGVGPEVERAAGAIIERGFPDRSEADL